MGEMNPGGFDFDKTYENGNTIKYKFEKNENDIWIGRYSANETIGDGLAYAKIHLDWPNVDMFAPRDTLNPELLIIGMLERMLNKRMLIPVNEELVKR
jgi:hypothetical protein